MTLHVLKTIFENLTTIFPKTKIIKTVFATPLFLLNTGFQSLIYEVWSILFTGILRVLYNVSKQQVSA